MRIYDLNNDISCKNVTDQFAVGNNKAKLTYPVSLALTEELYTLTNNNSSFDVINTKNESWWSFSPNNFGYYFGYKAYMRYVSYIIDLYGFVSFNGGVHPVVSLGSGAMISSGTGSEADPFVISE